jgi:hypothetical protein
MTKATDARNPNAVKDYLLIAFCGGMQHGGYGNGSASVLTMVNATDFVVLGTNPIDGTAKADNGEVTLDLHSVAATLPSTDDDSQDIAVGDCYVYVLGVTYNDDSFYFSDFKLSETKLSTLLAYVAASTTHGLDDLRVLDSKIDLFGFFWALLFASEASTGLPGKLFFGRGDEEGDSIDVYDVTQAGAGKPPLKLDSDTLFSEADQYAMMNTMALVPYRYTGQQTNLKTKVVKSATPPPVASGKVSMADFLVARKRKAKK